MAFQPSINYGANCSFGVLPVASDLPSAYLNAIRNDGYGPLISRGPYTDDVLYAPVIHRNMLDHDWKQRNGCTRFALITARFASEPFCV